MSFNAYQPFLDYGLVPNPAVIFPTVIDNYEWGLFEDIAKDYYLCLKEFRAKEHKLSVWGSDQFQQELFDPPLLYTEAQGDRNLTGILRELEESPRTLCPCLSPSPVPDIWTLR